MGFFSNIIEKIPILSNIGAGKRKSNKSSVELQFDKAMNLMENANGEDAVEILEKIADIGIMDQNYKNLGTESLKILGEFLKQVSIKTLLWKKILIKRLRIMKSIRSLQMMVK